MNKLLKFLHNGFLDLENINSEKISKHFREPLVPEVDLDLRSHGSSVMSKMDSLPSKTKRLSQIQIFVMTELAKPAESFFSSVTLT